MRARRQDRGYALLAALVVLLLVSISLAILATALQIRMRLVRQEAEALQLGALSDAALAEALYNLTYDEEWAGKDEHSLKKIVKCCGFGGTSQFSRAFRARFGVPPRQYRTLVREQDLDWHEARLMADGFDTDSMLWRHRGLTAPKNQ